MPIKAVSVVGVFFILLLAACSTVPSHNDALVCQGKAGDFLSEEPKYLDCTDSRSYPSLMECLRGGDDRRVSRTVNGTTIFTIESSLWSPCTTSDEFTYTPKRVYCDARFNVVSQYGVVSKIDFQIAFPLNTTPLAVWSENGREPIYHSIYVIRPKELLCPDT